MVELIWDGKYDKDGKRTAPPRLKLPFQTVETINLKRALPSSCKKPQTLTAFPSSRNVSALRLPTPTLPPISAITSLILSRLQLMAFIT